MTSDQSAHPDDLVTLVAKPTEFEAHAIVAVLEDAGIEAFAFGAMHAILPMGERLTPVPVQVRQADFEKAQAVLEQNIADSVDLDWNEVDVGLREDSLPLTAHTKMPWMAKLGFGVSMLVLAGMLLAVLGMIIAIVRG